MILVSLSGGIGNQLFQYAAALVMSANNPDKIIIDLGFYDVNPNVTPRSFKLDQLGAQYKKKIYINNSRLLRKFWWIRSKLIGRFINKYVYIELHENKNFLVDSRIFKKNDLAFLNGYWQCKDYPIQAASFLNNNLFRFCINKGSQQEIFDQKDKNNRVSIHIRRGDYTSELLVCSKKYFANAINLLTCKLKNNNLVWYIFSDDIEWAKSNILPPGETIFVSHSVNRSDIDDFTAMTYCNHHIISNSSFSWWAAFISQNYYKESLVIAPQRWWENIPAESISIYPSNWDIIEV